MKEIGPFLLNYELRIANKTASIGVAGLTLAGGEDKSYYVQVEGSNNKCMEHLTLKQV